MRHEAAVAVAAKATSAWWQVAGDGGPFLTVNIFIIMGESIKYKHQQLLSTIKSCLHFHFSFDFIMFSICLIHDLVPRVRGVRTYFPCWETQLGHPVNRQIR